MSEQFSSDDRIVQFPIKNNIPSETTEAVIPGVERAHVVGDPATMAWRHSLANYLSWGISFAGTATALWSLYHVVSLEMERKDAITKALSAQNEVTRELNIKRAYRAIPDEQLRASGFVVVGGMVSLLAAVVMHTPGEGQSSSVPTKDQQPTQSTNDSESCA